MTALLVRIGLKKYKLRGFVLCGLRPVPVITAVWFWQVPRG